MIFSAEWTYLLKTRKVGDEDSVFSFVRIKYGENATDTVSGVIIYPDDFSFSEVGVASMAFGARLTTQINAVDWEALENAGCIFLPGTRSRVFNSANELDISEQEIGLYTYYWSSSAVNASNSRIARFHLSEGFVYPANEYGARFVAFSVRLVQDL